MARVGGACPAPQSPAGQSCLSDCGDKFLAGGGQQVTVLRASSEAAPGWRDFRASGSWRSGRGRERGQPCRPLSTGPGDGRPLAGWPRGCSAGSTHCLMHRDSTCHSARPGDPQASGAWAPEPAGLSLAAWPWASNYPLGARPPLLEGGGDNKTSGLRVNEGDVPGSAPGVHRPLLINLFPSRPELESRVEP